jgi:molybdopterin/thiamine biosynthesis adenylyltransferase
MKERADLDQKYVGTVFDRQVRIEDWNQDVLSKQTVLCLGAGGLGSVVIMNLLRLGVGRIIVVDYDKVDVHNLNRQLMYSVKDVGKSKVHACIENSAFHNVGGTVLNGFEGCAVTNWHRIVDFAQQSDFIFNMIDYGDWFDAAMQSLCFKLGKPFVMGGTFALSMIVDYLAPKGKPCYWCLTDDVADSKELSAKIHPDLILTYSDLKFLPKNNNPIGRSSVCICTACGEFMIAHYLNYLFFDKDYKTQRCIFYPTSFETMNFPL